MPWIAGDFGEFSQLNWIVSAFNLTSAAFIPCWAQLSDVYGRNWSINMAIILMLVGSALCTAAPTDAFPVLLLGRGFQGLAAAGLNVTVRTILADRVSLKENAKNWSIFAFVGGTSYGLGPVIGGYLTSANWRWCFAINLPIGVVALGITFFVLRKELLGPQPIPELDETATTGRRTKFTARLKTIDWGGNVLFMIGLGLLILALTWGGVSYPWASAAVIVSLVLGILFSAIFFYWESLLAPGHTLSRRLPWQKAMIPWEIVQTRDILVLFFSEATSGMGMYAVLYFCNIYFISVQDYEPDEAGVQLLYFIPGLSVGVILCSLLCNRWPRMTWPPIFLGTLIEPIGIGLVAWAMYTEHKPTVFGMMGLVGVGAGLRFMAAPLHGVGHFRKHRAAVIGLMAVAIPFGGTIGLTIMSAVFNNTSGLNADADFSHIRHEAAELQAESKQMAKMGCVWAFVAITPVLLFAWFAAFFLGNVKLGRGTGPDEDGSQNIVIKEPYLFFLLKGGRIPDQVTAEGIRLESSDGAGSWQRELPFPASAQMK